MLSKIDEPFNYRFHGNFDVSAIADQLKKYPDDWFINQERQNAFEAHKETFSIPIYDHDFRWSAYDSYNVMPNPNQPVMMDILSPIIKTLEQVHDGKIGKCMFIRLPAHKDVAEHNDFGEYMGVVRRHHMAITTNDKAFFFVNKESKNMKVGECWEINNSHRHSVQNNGDTERIHLMFDILPNKFIK
jgi:hypothetical protein